MRADSGLRHRLAAFATCVLLSVGAASTHAAVPGGVAVIPLEPDIVGIRYRDRPVMIYERTAYVGVGIGTPPGRYHVVAQTQQGERRIEFEVVSKTYPEQQITIANPKLVNPDTDSLPRIRRESASMHAVFTRFTREAVDLSGFMQPVTGPISSEFGFRRVFNGEPRNPHSGMDIAAPRGTPIANPAVGRVALTGNFYFNGNTVLVDHGQGLVTMVCHLDSIAVSEGQTVAPGEILGHVGATGRATGPHLHWSMSLNGVRVDPAALLRLFPPADDPHHEPAP